VLLGHNAATLGVNFTKVCVQMFGVSPNFCYRKPFKKMPTFFQSIFMYFIFMCVSYVYKPAEADMPKTKQSSYGLM